jgi:lysozyme
VDKVYEETVKTRIKKNEGYELKVYSDTEGNDTGGYGHKMKKGEIPPKNKSGWAKLFEKDFDEAKKGALGLLKGHPEHPQEVIGVIIEMIFNMGKSGVLEFEKMLKALKNKDYDKAADEMLDSDWAAQVNPAQLDDGRAERLSKIVRQFSKPEEEIVEPIKEAAELEEDLTGLRDPFSEPIISGAAAVPLEGEQVREKIKYLAEVIQEYIPQGLGGAAAIDELDALRNPFQALEWLQDKIDNAVEELDIDKDDLYKTIRDIDIEEELRKLNVEGLETLEPEELERLEVDDEIKEILFQPDEDEVEEVLFHPDDKFFNDEEGIYDDQDFMHPSYFTEEEKDKYLDITRTDDDGMYHDVKWWKEKEEKEQAGKIDIRNDVEKEIKMYLDMLDEGIYGGEGHRVPYRAEERIRKTKDKKGHKVPYKAEDAI